jgi:hypothetical protein
VKYQVAAITTARIKIMANGKQASAVALPSGAGVGGWGDDSICNIGTMVLVAVAET